MGMGEEPTTVQNTLEEMAFCPHCANELLLGVPLGAKCGIEMG